MKDIKQVLSSNNIKPTYQRLKILKYLRNSRVHPTAYRIYQDLVKDMPTMSKTTVYNTLKALADKNIVVPISITGNEVRYESCGCSHHHFLCEKCHSVIDLEVVCPNLARREIKGNIIKELHGYFKGICARCAQKIKSGKKVSGSEWASGKEVKAGH